MSELATLYIVAAPSGAGKSSLLISLLEHLEGVRVSVSHTTRAPRPGEVDGEHYNFVSVDDFKAMVARDAFIEHAEVFDNFYGTSREWVESQLQQGTDVILEIDWQGARLVRELFPKAVGVFILPPSRQALQARLKGRGQDSDEIIARRMRDAVSESSHYGEFDYLIVNDDFDTARQELASIIVANRQKIGLQSTKLAPMIEELLA